jgi:O-Antigen ligase
MIMESFRGFEATRNPQSAMFRPLFWLLVSLISLVPLCLVLPLASTRVGVGAIVLWTILIWIAISFARGRSHYVVPLWVAFYPYCYSLFLFPQDRPIFTVDRAIILVLVIEMLIVSRQGLAAVPLTRDVLMSGYIWCLYLLVCFLSLALRTPSNELGIYRLLVEGMVMPAVFGLYAIRYFPAIEDLQKLHICACILGLGLFTTGLFELTTGIDLFPWGGVPLFTESHLRRADGPFEQQVVLSVVASLTFFFILYLGRVRSSKQPTWLALLHKAGCLASLGAALLPLNRGLIVALFPIAIIDSCVKDRMVSRRAWVAFFSLVLLAALATKVLDPLLYEERVASPDNVYQRIAQHEETLRVFREYPFFGVGFAQYHDFASQNPRYMARWRGIESMTVQHNVLMTVLTDQGILGLVLYCSSQAFLIRAIWRIRKAFPPGWLAFLYCVLVYQLIGMDYATVYFPDINLFYILILGVIYQVQSRIAHAELPGNPASLQMIGRVR